MQVLSAAVVNSFRKFTLTSGFNSTNTMFVRVKDGYAVGADPLMLKRRNGELRAHHVCGEGFLYGARKGYVVATLKRGQRGWSDIAHIRDIEYMDATVSTYRVFNPFIGVAVEISTSIHKDGTRQMTLSVGDLPIEDVKELGTYATILGEFRVFAPPFKGLRNLLYAMRQLPEWAVRHWEKKSYNANFTRMYNYGHITKTRVSALKLWSAKWPDRELPVSDHRIVEVRPIHNTCCIIETPIWSYDGRWYVPNYKEAAHDAAMLGLITPPTELQSKFDRIIAAQCANFSLNERRRSLNMLLCSPDTGKKFNLITTVRGMVELALNIGAPVSPRGTYTYKGRSYYVVPQSKIVFNMSLLEVGFMLGIDAAEQRVFPNGSTLYLSYKYGQVLTRHDDKWYLNGDRIDQSEGEALLEHHYRNRNESIRYWIEKNVFGK